jgi:HAD superfamily hydrolase (TIGR01509 family)
MANVTIETLRNALLVYASNNPQVKALLFDLDGTLVNTMPLHYEAYRIVFGTRGGIFEFSDFNALSGPPAHVSIPLFAKAAGITQKGFDIQKIHSEKKAAFKMLLTQTQLDLLPAGRLLDETHRKYKIAVVTSGNKKGAEEILLNLNLQTKVNIIISGDDVSTGKPDPEPYHLALKKLAIDRSEVIAFEDHDHGIASAISAGLRVVDVRNGAIL